MASNEYMEALIAQYEAQESGEGEYSSSQEYEQVQLLTVILVSFGHTYGPYDADETHKLTSLPNPPASQRRNATGLNKSLRESVLKDPTTATFYEKLLEGVWENVVRAAETCEGRGLHRSVSIVVQLQSDLRDLLRESDLPVPVYLDVIHRDVEKRDERRKQGNKRKNKKTWA